MKKIILIITVLISISSYAGKEIPADILDKNASLTFTFNPRKYFKEGEIKKKITSVLTQSGINLVHSQDYYSTDQVANFKIEVANKEVEYYVSFQAINTPSADLFNVSFG